MKAPTRDVLRVHRHNGSSALKDLRWELACDSRRDRGLENFTPSQGQAEGSRPERPAQTGLPRTQKLLSMNSKKSPRPCSSTQVLGHTKIPPEEPHHARDKALVPGSCSLGAFPKAEGPWRTQAEEQHCVRTRKWCCFFRMLYCICQKLTPTTYANDR